MSTINITAARESGNETVFNVIDSDSNPVDLTALNATVVTVEVCNDGSVIINSNSSDVSFLNDTITVKFGMLDLTPSGQLYFPKISYVTVADSEPEVIAGEEFATEIKLKVIC